MDLCGRGTLLSTRSINRSSDYSGVTVDFANNEAILSMEELIRERLISLLDYTRQLALLTQDAHFTTKGYRTLLYTEQKLHNKVGIHYDVPHDGTLAWLKIDRLLRRDPPRPTSVVADWVELDRDPTKHPRVRDAILRRAVPKEEAERLVAIGQAEAEDVMEASNADADVRDVRICLKNLPEIKVLIDEYLAGPWLEWSSEEVPKLETIAIYDKFFNLCQRIEGAGAENPLEVVWGLGFALWKPNRKTLEHPIIEAQVELRIDPKSKAIVVTARDLDARYPQFYLSPFTELGLESVKATQDRMRETFEKILSPNPESGITDADEFSPFKPNSFRPVLEVAAGLLTSDGQYWPEVNDDPEDREHPKPSSTLTITDTWAIYARPRGVNVIIDDIDGMIGAVTSTNVGDIPLASGTIVGDPGRNGTPGFPSGSPHSDFADSAEDNEVLFPKLHNESQLRIIKRLQHEDGVVVQGPPGTGKTHTIANIICHYLASSKSVLVVSKGEPALAVLRDQIPEGIRDVTISLLTNEREGLKQLEGAITCMANDVVNKNVETLEREIRLAQERIDLRRKELAEIDKRLWQYAEDHSAKIPDSLKVDNKKWPWEAAKTIAGSMGEFSWLDDEIGFEDRFVNRFTNDDIEALRQARCRLGDDISYLGEDLPDRSDLPSTRDIGKIHECLIEAANISEAPGSESLPQIVAQDDETKLCAARAVKTLLQMQQALEVSCGEEWIESLLKNWILNSFAVSDEGTVENAVAVLESLLRRRASFKKQPVFFPEKNFNEQALRQAVERGTRTGKPFATFSFGARELKSFLHEMHIAGQPPSDADDWSYILDYLDFRKKIVLFAYRWNALAEDFPIPELDVDPSSIERWLGKSGKSLLTAFHAAMAYRRDLVSDMTRLFSSAVDCGSLVFDPKAIDVVIARVNRYLKQQELGESRYSIEKIQGYLLGQSGPIFEKCRAYLEAEIRDLSRKTESVERSWSEILTEFDRLRSLEQDLSTVAEISSKIEESGAPRWAERARTIPAEATEDTTVPNNWESAWSCLRLKAYLERIDGRKELAELARKRIRAQNALERGTQELVRAKTFLGLKNRMQVGARASALRQFLSAIRGIGRGTGIRANRYRGDARRAMSNCMEAVPCWVMPTWRVSEALPPTLGSFDLVIIDEASQSDIMALPSILRGKKVLVVGDDRQVSPSSVGLEERKLLQLRHGYLKDQPFADLMMPGVSLYELAQAVFPSGTIMLDEHFRCVEPIIRFSLQFYPEKFVPLRIPKASERLDPPLIDVYIKNASRKGKLNKAEAKGIVDEIERLVDDPAYENRTIGVVSLLGNQQANLIQNQLLDRIGEERFLRHQITCGDPPVFQGKERDIIFLSMVAVPNNTTAQTSRQFQQRYNVALSRARDRVYLYRSVSEEDLPNEDDLKLKVIRHFHAPMPAAAERMKNLIDLCDSDFERDVFRRLTEMDYRVTPQVAVGEYRIDLVVDGGDDRRLAIELDGDKYHGPDRWFDDYARQKTLERMGWTFWRCWGSSFALDPDGCMDDLVDTLEEHGIKPIGRSAGPQSCTEHRVLDAYDILGMEKPEGLESSDYDESADDSHLSVGDSITVVFEELNRHLQLFLIEGESDIDNGRVSVTSDLGKKLRGLKTDEESEIEWQSKSRKCTVLKIQRNQSTDISQLDLFEE